MHRFGDSSLDFYGADKQTDCWTNRQALLNSIIFAARRYASAVYAVVVCRPSVRLSVTIRCSIETTGRIELGLAWRLPST